MSQYGYSFKGKYFILGAVGLLGIIFTDGFLQILFGILVFFITLKIMKLNEYKLIYKSKKFN